MGLENAEFSEKTELSLKECLNFKKSPYNSAFFIKNLPI